MSAKPKDQASDLAYKKHEQDILLKISSGIISTLDYEKVLQIISDGMSEILDIETAAIYLLEKEDELYLGATTPSLDPNMPDSLRKAFVRDHPHIRRTILARLPQVIPDTKSVTLSEAEKNVVELRKLRSLLYFPFIQGEYVLGVLILGTCNKTRVFSNYEINLGQTIANQLSIGIQNARLHYNMKMQNEKLETEIKERKKVEYALRNSETHLSNALRIAKLGHWEYDISSDTFTFTDEFFEMHHTTAKTMGGYKMSSKSYTKKFIHPDDHHIVKKEIEKIINSKDDNFSDEIEHKILYADGMTGYIIVRYRTLKDREGKALRVLGVNQDITKQKLAEKELKEHRDNLEKLVNEKASELDNVVKKLKETNKELSKKNELINKKTKT